MILVYVTAFLPYRFPPQAFVVGASFEVGFNNAVSFLGYLAGVGVMACIAASLLRPLNALDAPDVPSNDAGRLYGVVVLAVVILHIVVFAGLYAYKRRFVFGESLYFQSLLYRMSTGERPYLDFSFYYGPLMLSPAFWLSRLVSLDLAYGIWFVVTYVVGLVFLATSVHAILKESRARVFWFCLLAFGLFNPLTGLNETLTRFLFPSIVFLSAASFMRYGGVGRALCAIGLLSAAVTYSFDVAALAVAAVGCQGAALIWFGSPSRRTVMFRGAALFAFSGALSAAFFLLVDPTGGVLRQYPAIAQSYSGGAHNVPIYPHLPFIALASLTVAALGGLLRLLRQGSHRLAALMAASYALIAVIAQRAAFGAAEPSHFGYFGVPTVCLALFVTTLMAGGKRLRVWLAAVLVIGIVMPMQYYYASEFLPFVLVRFRQAAAVSPSGSAPAESSADLERGLRDLVRAVGSDRPYLMHDLEYASLPVYREFRLRYATYFTMLINARDAAGIERSITDVRRRGAVVVLRKQRPDGPARDARVSGATRLLDLVSGAHTQNSDLNVILEKSRSRLIRPFLDFVQREYVVLYDHNGLVAYGPRNPGLP